MGGHNGKNIIESVKFWEQTHSGASYIGTQVSIIQMKAKFWIQAFYHDTTEE